MDEIRKFSAIYGRFDCKRKPEKPLTLHEVSFQLPSNYSSFMIVMLQFLPNKISFKKCCFAGLCERGSCPDLPSGSCHVDSQGRAFPPRSPGFHHYHFTICIVIIITTITYESKGVNSPSNLPTFSAISSFSLDHHYYPFHHH